MGHVACTRRADCESELRKVQNVDWDCGCGWGGLRAGPEGGLPSLRFALILPLPHLIVAACTASRCPCLTPQNSSALAHETYRVSYPSRKTVLLHRGGVVCGGLAAELRPPHLAL
jgi:hypothetical protein